MNKPFMVSAPKYYLYTDLGVKRFNPYPHRNVLDAWSFQHKAYDIAMELLAINDFMEAREVKRLKRLHLQRYWGQPDRNKALLEFALDHRYSKLTPRVKLNTLEELHAINTRFFALHDFNRDKSNVVYVNARKPNIFNLYWGVLQEGKMDLDLLFLVDTYNRLRVGG